MRKAGRLTFGKPPNGWRRSGGDYPLASDVLAYDPECREQLWKARKALYLTLYRFDPRKKPINFVDDVVVRAERISELIRYLEEFFGSQRVPGRDFWSTSAWGNAPSAHFIDIRANETGRLFN